MTTTSTDAPLTTPTPATEVLAEADPAARLRTTRFRIGGSPHLVGPHTHLAPERDRLAALPWTHFTVKRMGATVGAELHGIDITEPLTDEVVDEIRAALFAFKVIFSVISR